MSKLAWGIGLGIMLAACNPSVVQSNLTWKTYRNSRFGFEFPYPSNWIAAQPPENGDGQAFTDPKNPAVEIRGWAGYNVSGTENQTQINTLNQNFTTKQGLPGSLKVHIGQQVSSMTLTLVDGEVIYNWQGQSPEDQFADYYDFFYQVATEYRVLPQRNQP